MPRSTFSGRSVNTWVCGYEWCGIVELAWATWQWHLSYNWTAGVMWLSLMWAAVDYSCVQSRTASTCILCSLQFIYTAGNAQRSCSTVSTTRGVWSVPAVWPLLTVASYSRNSCQILLQAALLQCICSGRTRPFMRPTTSSGGSRPLQLTL